MARLLVERETIFSEEVDMLMDGKSPEEIMAFMDENEQKLSENPFERKSNPVIIKEKPAKEQPEKEQPANADDGAKKTPRKRSAKKDNSEKKENSDKADDSKKD